MHDRMIIPVNPNDGQPDNLRGLNMSRTRSFYAIVFLLLSVLPAQSEFLVKDFGAKGDGITLDTKAIQAAINKCSEVGGRVVFTPGKYLTGSIELKSNVAIVVEGGAVILGSVNLEDYFERRPALKSYNDLFLRHSLFYAERVKHISIQGEGTIDGQGSNYIVTTKVKPDRYRNRPFLIRFVECEDVRVENVTLQNSASWMQHYLACRDLTIRGIKVYNHANQNNDMMDVDGCSNVVIADCIGDVDDDGITLKSTSPAITENVVVTNCVISCHNNAIKLGTESTGGFRNITVSNIVVKPSRVKTVHFGWPEGISGITLATVDGGILEGVSISNILIDGPLVPIFMRLGSRSRKHAPDAPNPPFGTFRHVSISNIIAKNIKSVGCSITGIPGHNVEDLSLSNMSISFSGGVSKGEFKTELEELEQEYPEATMWAGMLPSYGFFIRHARGIRMNNISMETKKPDQRPAILLDDVQNARISELDAAITKEASYCIGITRSSDITLRNSKVSGGTERFVEVSDIKSGNIILQENDLRNCNAAFKQNNEGQIILLNNIVPAK